MNTKTQRFLWSLAAAIIIILMMAVLFNSRIKKLIIADADSGTVYFSWIVKDGLEFAIEFIHSVNQSPVRDTFEVQGRRILPKATRFVSFGAGMQTELAEGQELVREEEGAMLITGFTNSFRELNYIVGTVSDHILFINNETISLRDMCGRNAHINIRVR